MNNINIHHDNLDHKTLEFNNSDGSVKENNSNIGLELLMNKKKTGAPNEVKEVKIKPTNVVESSNNDEFNLDKLLSGDTSIQSKSLEDLNTSIKIEPLTNESKGLKSETLNIDSLDEVKLDNSIFTLKTENTPTQKSKETIQVDSLSSNSIPKSITKEETKERPKTYEELQKDKFNLLCNLERLEARGIKVSKIFSMDSNYDEMKQEYERITRKIEIDRSVKFQRKMLMALVTGIEFLNNKFDPANIQLDGWSESVHEGINDYDDIFEELHDKYKEKATMAPELRLLITLIGSGFMFHLTQSLFKTTLPGVGDIMKQNPDLMNQFAKAAAGSMNGPGAGLGNLMGDLMGERGGLGSDVRNMNSDTRGEMRGPPNIDSILNKVDSRNKTKIDIDNLSSISDSDIEGIKNINLERKRRKYKIDNNNQNEISLDI